MRWLLVFCALSLFFGCSPSEERSQRLAAEYQDEFNKRSLTGRINKEGLFEARARLDPTKPNFANEAAIRDVICSRLLAGKILSFEPDGPSHFKATCERPIFLRKEVDFPNYPQAGYTYLTFSDPAPGVFQGHGFQVSYYDSAKSSWLWYPRNAVSLPEEWKLEDKKLCFKHPSNTYNPVGKSRGGEFKCQSIDLSRKIVVARLDGDPFELKSGKVPSRRDKCAAPKEFEFDRERFRCSRP